MPELTDEQIDAHLEQHPDEDTPLVQRLRSQVKELRKTANEVPDLKARLAVKDFGAVLTEAKLGDLNDDQSAALFDLLDEADRTPEKAREKAERLGWVPAEPDSPVTPEEQAVIDRQAATANGAGPPVSTGVIKPEEAAGWPMDKRMAFMDKYPDEHEKLLRGETVQGVVF